MVQKIRARQRDGEVCGKKVMVIDEGTEQVSKDGMVVNVTQGRHESMTTLMKTQG